MTASKDTPLAGVTPTCVPVPASVKGIETSLVDLSSLQRMYEQASLELDQLEPELDATETAFQQLQLRYGELKQRRQRLITLKLSLQPMLDRGEETPVAAVIPPPAPLKSSSLTHLPLKSAVAKNDCVPVKAIEPRSASYRDIAGSGNSGGFSADIAFNEVNQRLRQRDSVNYEIFRAIVYAGGEATTEQIKHYLLEQDIRQPANREAFTDVPLADISARANYLVKKGIISIESRGRFRSIFGWLK